MTDRPYICTPGEFLADDYSFGELGDIRDTTIDEAKVKLAELRVQRSGEGMSIGDAAIALLAFRRDDVRESFIVPERGLIYPIYPSPEAEREWQAFKNDLIAVRTAGLLHVYDRTMIVLPI